MKQLLQIEHNIVKTPKRLRANKLAFNKPGRGFERTRGFTAFLWENSVVDLSKNNLTEKSAISFSVIYF